MYIASYYIMLLWSVYVTSRIAVVGKALAEKATDVEKWYGTQYKMDNIKNDQLEQWEKAGFNELLKLPTKNEFVPTNFELFTDEKVIIVCLNPWTFLLSLFGKYLL